MCSETATPSFLFSRYIDFDRSEWQALRANTPLLLTEQDLATLRGINEQVSLHDLEELYVPLSRLLNLQVAATQHLYEARRAFLQTSAATRVPFIIAIAGSVAVGKSTFSRVLRACLAQWPDHPHVDLVTTDGFLHSNKVLAERGLMNRKGFPESYDQRALLKFLAEIKGGIKPVCAPVYSHLLYDIVPQAEQCISQPDILIVEGLNVLQSPGNRDSVRLFVSDYFDFSIFLDADPAVIETWYIERFLKLRETVFQSESSYFHRYATLTESEAISTAHEIWTTINLRNLNDNILPTRERASLIVEKAAAHVLERVRLRKV